MKKIYPIALILLVFVRIVNAQSAQFLNGNWFNGSEFVPTIWYSIDGKLTKTKPGKIDKVIDLKNGFVVPPFGEAHNHNVAEKSEEKFIQLRDMYLRSGIFYVKNPNSLRKDKSLLIERKWINHSQSIDATFASGGITSEGGHPSLFYYGTPNGEGDFYHFIETQEELGKKWKDVLANDPDFIKIFLLFSEEHAKRKNNPNFKGHYGLDPQLVTIIVSKAHQTGLRVAAHIETSYDFHVAVEAGVDEISHMPGFRGDPKLGIKMPDNFETRFSIKEEDAITAAKKSIVVTTTIGDFVTIPKFYPLRKKGDLLHRENIKKLQKAGVKIVLGSDSYEKNSLIEVSYLKDLNVYSNLELLKLLCENTPQSIFPNRKIGCLGEGCETSFLVLRKSPIENISNIKTIFMAFKQGAPIDLY